MVASLACLLSNLDASSPSDGGWRWRLVRLLQNGAAFWIALLLWSSSAEAQIVNVQPLLGKDLRSGWTVAGEGALDFRAGNISLLQAAGSSVVRYIRGRHTVFLLTRGEYGMRNLTTTKDRFLARHFEHLRYRALMWGPFDAEVFVQFDSDQFRRLAVRAVGGTGPRIKLVTTPNVDAAIAALYMFEYQQIRRDDKPDSGAIAKEHRASAYFIVTVKLDERLRIGQAVYVQPRLDQRRDLRVLSESELLVAVGRYVSLKLSVTLAFDSTPPANVQPFDTALKTALQFAY